MRTTLHDQFDTNVDLETEGVWITMGICKRTKSPIRFKLAAITNDNKNYQKLMETLGKPYRNVPDLSVEIVEELAKAGFIGAICLDWEGVEEFRTDKLEAAWAMMPSPDPTQQVEGVGTTEVEEKPYVPMPYSPENAKDLFDTLPRLYMQLSRIASNPQTFKANDPKDDEDTGKN